MVDRGEYIGAIETLFLKYRGGGFVLTPKDEAVAEGWYRERLPLKSVLRGLGGAIEEVRGKPGFRPRSLKYFAPKVEEHTKASTWTRAQSTEPTARPARPLGENLSASVTALLGRSGLESQGVELAALAAQLRVCAEGQIWETLPEFESRIDQILVGALSPGRLAAIETEATQIASRECGPDATHDVLNQRETRVKSRLCRSEFSFPGLTTLACSDS